MPARERHVPRRDGLRRCRRRNSCGPRDAQSGSSTKLRSKELGGDRSAEDLGQERRSGIAGLPDLLTMASFELPAARKGLQPQNLLRRKWAAVPVKGPRGRTGICRHRPGRLGLRELEKKGPEPAPVSEERWSLSALREVLIIPTLRDRGQQIRETPAWSRRLVQTHALKRIPSAHRTGAMGDKGPCGSFAISKHDDEGTSAALRSTEIGRIEHSV